MHVLRVRNVHAALPEAIRHLKMNGIRRESRNGPVLVAPTPVATVYSSPLEKVEFWPSRDSNPTFHLMEALWMLGGRNDVSFPTMFNSRFGQFSDDGRTFNGAYGFRWREHFCCDQLLLIADRLRDNPEDRRQVLSMWDGNSDLEDQHSRDLPCNTHVYFSRDHLGVLHMTVCCRSNDIVWGLAGSNAVHFGFLLEYMALRIGCPAGTYTQVSNNFHGYLKTLEPLLPLADCAAQPHEPQFNPYDSGDCNSCRLLKDGETIQQFDADLRVFLDNGGVVELGTRNWYLRHVAGPLASAYATWRAEAGSPHRHERAMSIASECRATDWKLAAIAWYQRRMEKAKKSEENA